MKATIQPSCLMTVGLETPSDLVWMAVVRSSTILQELVDVPFGHAGAVSGVLVCPT